MISTNYIIDGVGNTRLKPIAQINIHPDYLRIRRKDMTVGEFAMMLEFFGVEYDTQVGQQWSPGSKCARFENKLIGTKGFVGGFTLNEDGLVSCMVDLTGSYWAQKNAVDSWRLLRGLYHAYKVKCSRIDLAIDDFTFKVIPVDEMVEASERCENAGFRKRATHSSGKCGEEKDKTEEFGSRNSGKMVRCYAHNRDRMRFEAEFKRDKAHPIFVYLATLERPENAHSSCTYGAEEKASSSRDDAWNMLLQKAMGSVAVSAIDFRAKGARKDHTRAGFRDRRRLSFYQQFINKIGNQIYKIHVPKPPKTIIKTVDWLYRQCAPTLAMLREGLGSHKFNLLIQEILEDGNKRMDKLKECWSREIKAKPKIVPIRSI